MPTVQRDGEVVVVDLGDGENRFTLDWLAAFDAALDEAEATSGPAALVTTATGKFWSNGLDLAWMDEHPELVPGFVTAVHRVLARVLTLPLPTVAAVQGHAFAGGGMLALAHDQRVMRADRGFFCLPEVAIGIPFTPGMTAMIAARLPVPTAHAAMTTGRRYGGTEALAAGIVDAAVGAGEVLPAAVERARALAPTRGTTLGVIKRRLYAGAVAALGDDVANGLLRT